MFVFVRFCPLCFISLGVLWVFWFVFLSQYLLLVFCRCPGCSWFFALVAVGRCFVRFGVLSRWVFVSICCCCSLQVSLGVQVLTGFGFGFISLVFF